MALPRPLNKAAQESELFVLDLERRFEIDLRRVLREISVEILNIIAEIPAINGRFVNDEARLLAVGNARLAIINEGNQRFNQFANRWGNEFVPVAGFAVSNLATSGITTEFTDGEASVLESSRDAYVSRLTRIGDSVFSEIADNVVSTIVTSSSVALLTATILSKLSSELPEQGQEVSAGRTLFASANLNGADGLIQSYRNTHKMLADKEDVQRFLYFGSLVRDSRQWCISHANKIWTKQQIDSWQKISWQGKIEGSNVWVTLGGYRCIHHLNPISNSISESDLGIAA